MASRTTQERLTAARKRAREQMTAERRNVEDLVVAFHRAALAIEDLTEQLAVANGRRDEAVDALIATGRSARQVADLLGVELASLATAPPAAPQARRRSEK